MKYSIIIPTYNEEGAIRQCLESIRDQMYDRSQFEIILSDANSKDQTQMFAQPLCDRIVSTEKRGIAVGRNIGAASAKGEFFVFIDADATLQPEFLSNCEESFRDRSVVAVTGVARPGDGTLFPRFVYRMTYVLARFFNIFGLSLFPGVCVAYRADAFRKLKGFREDFGIVEDLDLSRRASKLGKCVVQKQAIAYVSTRRLEKHALSTVLFHVYSDLKYLLTGKSAPRYPKREEISTWRDLWKAQ
jgi:glycosyltransferase involved in cell wall biosynthesis